MARAQRLHVRGGIYYVKLRVNGDGPLFPGSGDQREFESLVARALRRSGAELHTYAWLPASANFLIQVDNVPLGRIVQGIAGPYAKIVNQRLGQRGHRFEHPHGAILVQAGSDILKVVAHIHRMALESEQDSAAAMRAVSSHSAYLGERIIPWLTTEFVHELLRARGSTPRAGYRKLIRDDEPTFLAVSAKDGRGTRMHGVNETPFVRWLNERAQPPRTSLPELTDAIASRLGVDANELRSISRRRELSFARAVTAWYATNGSIATLTDVARHFDRDPSTLSVGVTRYVKEKPEFFLGSLDEFLRGAPLKIANGKGR